MTSLSPDNVVDLRDTRTTCCDVTAAVEQGMSTVKSIPALSSSNESAVEFTSDAGVIVASSGGMFASSAASNGALSRDHATQSITTDTENDVNVERQTMTTTSASIRQTNESVVVSLLVTGNGQITSDVGGVSSQRNSKSSRAATLPGVTSTTVTPNISVTHSSTLFISASRDHKDSWLPLALRSSADNDSVSAAVGSNMADRRASSGLLREEVATVGAAVAGVLLFWSLLAFTMCAIVRMRKRQQRRHMRGSDVDAQTAMMEAMVRAELARGRSRVSDSRVPTYVNVSEILPRSSSSCDLDMSDFFHFVLDNNRAGSHGVWKKHYNNDVISARPPRDHFAGWQDGSRTVQTRGSACLAATHWANNSRQPAIHEDHYCLLNGTKHMANSGYDQRQCNGVLTKVKSLDSICKAADEPAAETKHRQRPRRRRRYGVKRSASTSRCLVSANNKPLSSVHAPANG